VLGGIAALAALAIPGIGPLLAAGPIATVISGALVGGTLGGLVGSFTGLGIPTERAQEYEATVRKGGIVVAINVPDRSADDQVTGLLRHHGAREIASYTQAL
jgi:tetrahydromethanopterin S-methyltransferase subunit C